MIFSVTKSSGLRHCHNCDKKIYKGTKFLLYRWPGNMFNKYENFCPKCAIKKLRDWVIAFDGMADELEKYLNWDN